MVRRLGPAGEQLFLFYQGTVYAAEAPSLVQLPALVRPARGLQIKGIAQVVPARSRWRGWHKASVSRVSL